MTKGWAKGLNLVDRGGLIGTTLTAAQRKGSKRATFERYEQV